MKSGLLIVTFVVLLSGCTGSNRGNRVAVFSEGSSQAQLRVYSVTNDSSGTNTFRNAESQDVIKEDDTLLITFTAPGSIQLPAWDQRVKADGTITLIFNKVFQVAGKGVADLEKEIRNCYVPAFFTNLTVWIRISCSETHFVYVDGEFRNPGRYLWTNGMRLNDAIEAAGGFNEFAIPRVKLIHLDGTSVRFRLRGDWMRTNNPALRPDDKIHNLRDFL